VCAARFDNRLNWGNGRVLKMACRNLTKTFVGIRNASKANKSLRVRMDIRPSTSNASDDGSSDSGLLGANDSTPYKSVKDSLPPVWVDKIEKTEDDISKIQSKSKFPPAPLRSRLPQK